MCELMTIAMALVFTVAYFRGKASGKASGATFTAMLMFWGAALMWAVDCVAECLDGESLFDISREDAVLGGIILAAGLLVYGVLAVRERRALRRA
ncbi:MAG: hypothetical protein IK066_06260 [Kiritimatiellae bacterium]|nr:hypothetical protein [Kiritimatiellia bacterium]